jgi:hypothetical protein
VAAHIRNEPALALIYGTRDNYIGEFQKPVAEVREPATIVHMRRSGDCLLIAINDAGDVRFIRVGRLDSPGLELLSALDRATVTSALAAMQREVGDAA